MSTLQRTVFIFCILLLLAVICRGVVPPFTSLILAWDKAPSHGTNINYVLKWGTELGATNYTMNVGTNLITTVTNPTTGFLFFHVVARTFDGVESPPSNVYRETNYPAAPLQLRMVTNTTSSVSLEFLDASEWRNLVEISNIYQSVLVARKTLILRSKQTVPPPLP